jgi:hypothetical protein
MPRSGVAVSRLLDTAAVWLSPSVFVVDVNAEGKVVRVPGIDTNQQVA